MAVIKKDNSSDSLELDETYVNLSSPGLTATFSHDQSESEATSEPTIVADPIAASVAPSSVTEDYSFAPSEGANTMHQNNTNDNTAKQFGAGVVAAVITMPLLGPILATVAGLAAAYGTTQPGPAGDACRAAGDVAMIAKEKAKEVNQKHRIVDNTMSGAQGVIAKAQDVNGRHELVEKFKAYLIGTVRGVGEAFQFAAEKMKNRGTKNGPESEWETDCYEELKTQQR